MSLYLEYLKEREDIDAVETEVGVATYHCDQNGCYIIDIYVKPEFRKSGHATLLADEIKQIAKERGLNRLFGSVCPATKGANESLKVLLGYGFKLSHIDSAKNLIMFFKEI